MFKDFFKKLTSAFIGSRTTEQDLYSVVVKCKRCGEIIRTRVNLNNDLSVEYGPSGSPSEYLCRKVLMGEGRCYQQVEVRLVFSPGRKLLSKEISGGEFVEETTHA